MGNDLATARGAVEAVHVLREYGVERAALLDGEELERDMESVRMLASLGRTAREEVQIRVRQPLPFRALYVSSLGLVINWRAALTKLKRGPTDEDRTIRTDC